MAIISSRPTLALVKTRWRKKGERTLAERAGVIGANIWKVSLAIFKHMENEGFRFGSDRLATDVLAEFIAFQVQLADRTVYGRVSDEQRAALIGEVVGHLAATMDNNQRDLVGPGEHRKAFIDLLNTRFGEYAGFDYADGEPGYACLRFFATKVADAMAGGDNKWVVEQVMEIEAPEMVRFVRKLVDQALEAAPPAQPPARGA
ncbi:MAG: hypothetical protein AB7O31_16510 [Burkholderiales bacterium]